MRETNINVRPYLSAVFCTLPYGLDLESNQHPPYIQADAQPTDGHWPGLILIFFKKTILLRERILVEMTE